MSDDARKPPTPREPPAKDVAGPDHARSPSSSAADVAAFVARLQSLKAAGAKRGRLIFAMDATMSRRPTWDMALALQGDMFAAVKEVGTLDVQLVFFRGYNECRASRWVADPEALARLMTTVNCQGGMTQIGRVLAHACRETAETRVDALVYVGDCMEESIDGLAQRAGELGVLGVPIFLFQEGEDADARVAFSEMARLSRGAYCRFDRGSSRQLKELLTAVAVYAAGGRAALEALALSGGGQAARALIGQMRG